MRNFESCERMVKEAVARFGGLDILVNCAGGRAVAVPAAALAHAWTAAAAGVCRG